MSTTEFYAHLNESELAKLGTYCGHADGIGRLELWQTASGFGWHNISGERADLNGYESAKEALIALAEVWSDGSKWRAAGELLAYRLGTVTKESQTQSEPLAYVRHGQMFGSFRAVNVTRRTVKVALVSDRDLGYKVRRPLTYRWNDAARAFMRQGEALRADGIY